MFYIIVNGISLLVFVQQSQNQKTSAWTPRNYDGHFSVFWDIFSMINQFIYNLEILIVIKKRHELQAYSIQNSLLLIQWEVTAGPS